MKPVYRYDIEQNSDEWFAEKIGRLGASSAPDLLMDKKNKGYINLVNKIIEEKVTGEPCESKAWSGNQFTQRGHEFEPIARNDFELRTLKVVDIIGIVELDDWTMCSPDGLIGEDGLHQIKCPIFNTQREYHNTIDVNVGLSDNDLLKKIDIGYYKQCQFELFVTGRKYNIWTSYHPHLDPIDLKIDRDPDMIKIIKERLSEFKNEVNSGIKTLRR